MYQVHTTILLHVNYNIANQNPLSQQSKTVTVEIWVDGD